MIANLIGGFCAILIGVSLLGPLAFQIQAVAGYGTEFANSSASWGASVLTMIPGFFSIGILSIGIAVCYSSMRDAGIV